MRLDRQKRQTPGLKTSVRSIAAITFAFVVSLSGSAAKAETLKDVWVVTQKNEILGRVELFIAPDKIKAVLRNGELTLLSCAPTWNVVAYRQADHLGMQAPLANFANDGVKVLSVGHSLANATVRNQVDPALKTECREQIVKCHGRFYGVNDPTIFQASKKLYLKEMHFKTSRSIPIDSKSHQFLEGLYNMSRFDGVPLELAFYCTDGSVDRFFFTRSVTKEKRPDSFFEYPKSFHSTDMRTLLMPPVRQKNLQALLDDVIEEEKEADREKSKATPVHK